MAAWEAALFLFQLARRMTRSPDAQMLGSLSLATVGVGAVFYRFQEGLSWLDAVYFTVITLTTVGYGDFSPQTPGGKIFTIFYILVGLGIIAGLIGVVAELSVETARDKRAPDGD